MGFGTDSTILAGFGTCRINGSVRKKCKVNVWNADSLKRVRVAGTFVQRENIVPRNDNFFLSRILIEKIFCWNYTPVSIK